jgi:glycosyltransferase involved in cell wall biosynthesis
MLRIRPDVVQASDARELPYAVILMWLVGYTLIYDSHEDYFNQVYEYRGKTWKALFEALWLSAKEFVFARFCDRVFVTSASHQEKYERTLYGVDTAHLLPNFTPNWLSLPKPPYKASSTLRLVYVGTVNRYRGVLEVAKFSRRFNQQHQRRTLRFHYIGVSHPLVDELESQDLIVGEGAFSFPTMMENLQRYNVGVCLLHDIKKFRTSVPIKNFDYMAAGLPVLTSNFGEMKRYVSEAGAGLCIDPVEYEEFEEAILRLFDPAVRKRLGQAGQAYTRGPGSFDRYVKPYLDAIPDPK